MQIYSALKHYRVSIFSSNISICFIWEVCSSQKTVSSELIGRLFSNNVKSIKSYTFVISIICLKSIKLFIDVCLFSFCTVCFLLFARLVTLYWPKRISFPAVLLSRLWFSIVISNCSRVSPFIAFIVAD